MDKITTLIAFTLFQFSFCQTVSTITDGNFYDGIAIDSKNNIYCSDFYGDSVYKLDSNGTVSVFKNGFSNPNGIGINDQDEIFICDHTGNVIYKYDKDGIELEKYDNGLFKTPTNIEQLPNSTDMLVVEYKENKIKRLTTNGAVTELFSGDPLNGPVGIAFINNITYIGNYNDRKIFKFENNTLTEIAQLPATAENTNKLGFLTSLGNSLYATQIGEHKVYRINPSNGNISVFAGSTIGNEDGPISTATFNYPNGIKADSKTNKIYISDAGSKNLRIIDGVTLSNSLRPLKKNEIQLKLNTANDLTIIAKLNNFNKLTIKVLDISSKTIHKTSHNITSKDFKTSINIKNWAKGTYIFQISQGEDITIKKIKL